MDVRCGGEITNGVAKDLQSLGVHVRGEIVDYAEPSHWAESSDESSDEDGTQAGMMPGQPGQQASSPIPRLGFSIRAYSWVAVWFYCVDLVHTVLCSQAGHAQQDSQGTTPDTSSTTPSVAGQHQHPQQGSGIELTSGSSCSDVKEVKRRVNMDVSAMLALCSEMCNTDQSSAEETSKGEFALPILREMQALER